MLVLSCLHNANAFVDHRLKIQYLMTKCLWKAVTREGRLSVEIVGLAALQPSTMAPVTHVVIFQYKSSTTVEEKQNVASSFLALQERCLSPANPGFASPGKPYIVSIIGGSNNSKEPKAAGYEVSPRSSHMFRSLLTMRS